MVVKDKSHTIFCTGSLWSPLLETVSLCYFWYSIFLNILPTTVYYYCINTLPMELLSLIAIIRLCNEESASLFRLCYSEI